MISNKRKRNAIRRAVISLAISIIILAATGFSCIRLIIGPSEADSIDENTSGDYITATIYLIWDFYAEEYNSSGGETTAWYAVVPYEGKMLTVCLPERYFESAQAVLDSTYDHINGYTAEVTKYFVIDATIQELSESAETMLYDWFSLSSGWMYEAGLISEVGDYADHISPYMLRVDYVGGVSVTWAVVSGIAALLFLLYSLFEIVLILAKNYDHKPFPAVPASDLIGQYAEGGADANTDSAAPEEASKDGDADTVSAAPEDASDDGGTDTAVAVPEDASDDGDMESRPDGQSEALQDDAEENREI